MDSCVVLSESFSSVFHRWDVNDTLDFRASAHTFCFQLPVSS